MIEFRDAGGTLRTATSIQFRDAGNVLRTVTAVEFRDAGNTLRSVGGVTMTAVVSVNQVYGYGSSMGIIYVSTDPTYTTVTGGTPPYTHSWLNPDPAWSAINPGSAGTAFRSPALASGESSNTTFTDTITDALGATATVTVTADATNFGAY